MKRVSQRRTGGYCKKCRRDIPRRKPLVVIRGKPYCESCAPLVAR